MRPVGDLAAVPASIRAAGGIPARVPGCVHTDLMRAGLIPDPRIGMNEADQHWIGRTDWEYRCPLDLTPDQLAHERLDLACDCLDTIAEVSLNAMPLGTSQSAFHPHRFDLRAAARIGANELSILFRSPVTHIRAEQARLGTLPHNGDGLGWLPYNFIRKPACNFGWDWAPNVATCGITSGLRLECWSVARVRAVSVATRRIGDQWTLDVTSDVEWSHATAQPSISIVTEVGTGDGHCAVWHNLAPGVASITQTLDSVDADEWWPVGHGRQPRYQLSVTLCHGKASDLRASSAATKLDSLAPGTGPVGDRKPVDRATRTVAFRTVRLNTDPDEYGCRFQLEINGKPIFCKGANWIPEGLFPDDRADDVVRERVRQAAAANINMLRVWGGGTYECDAFHDECDKLGIMVWQDFMFACACYPEEPPFAQLIEAEARHHIARLSSHACVVLWCGGNECVWGYESWGHAASDVAGPWKQRVGTRGWGGGYWFDLLPRLMRELDPTRPYWPNSPFCGVIGESPNQQVRGNRHTWDAVFLDRPTDTPATSYRAIVPRFCTELGHQAPANLETLAAVFRPDELSLQSPSFELHQRGTGGTARHINDAMASVGPVPAGFSEWHHRAQELQAQAMRNGIEHHAAHRERGRCMGVVIWQFNDAWPGMSWSLVDSAGRPKPAYEAVKEAFARIP